MIDVGAKTGGRNNACFWLRHAAGWSRCSSQDNYDEDLQRLHEHTRTISLPDLHRPRTAAFDTLGLVVNGLRQYFCCLNGFMLSADAMALYAQILAACNFVHGDNTRPTTLATYKEWIIKVGRWDFADEMILAAAAIFLRICITTVPHTFVGDNAWAIAQHPEEDLWKSQFISDEIVLGNDDVHYGLLLGEPADH